MNSPLHQNTDNIMAALEASGVTPKARFWFVLRNTALWSVWFLSIVIGSVTLSVFWYALERSWYGFYEATHFTWLSFMLDTVPMVWLPVFGLLIFLAYIDMRFTRLGYRYPLWQIVGSSLAFSLVGGAICAYLGIGSMLDRQIGEYMPQYPSQLRTERDLWQVPRHGRLAGTVSVMENNLFITDAEGMMWELVTDAIDGMDIEMLVPGMHVRLLGMSSSSQFVVCGVLPGMENDDMPARKTAPYQKVVRERFKEMRETIKEETIVLAPCMKTPLFHLP